MSGKEKKSGNAEKKKSRSGRERQVGGEEKKKPGH